MALASLIVASGLFILPLIPAVILLNLNITIWKDIRGDSRQLLLKTGKYIIHLMIANGFDQIKSATTIIFVARQDQSTISDEISRSALVSTIAIKPLVANDTND